jgi:8-hydroxy-5-deazaflavin:NADPH oxidoreductase
MPRPAYPAVMKSATRIAVIGRGAVGSAVGSGWASLGHGVTFGVRRPSVADERDVRAACADADVIVLATPWSAVDEVLAQAGDLTGKIVVDCTNPLAMVDGRLCLALGFDRSGGEHVAARAPGARVYKTLNQTGAEVMAAARRFATPPVMYVAGDDAAGKAIVSGLVAALGFEAVDAGPLSNARLLEPLAMLWIDQALQRGAGRTVALARIHPSLAESA